MKDLLKQYFSKFKLVSINCVKKFKKLYPESINFLQTQLKENPNWLTEQNYITGLVKNITLPVCLFCQKELNYKQHLQHKKFCSRSCAAKFNSQIRTTDILNKKSKITIQQKYNVDNISQLPEIKQKIKKSTEQTCLKKYGIKNYSLYLGWQKILSFSQYVKPIFTIDQYLGYNHEYLFECCKCHNKFKSKIYLTGHISRTGNLSRVPRCFNCYPVIDKVSSSKTEKELTSFCKKYFPDLKENNYDITSPYEVDILIPDIKLAIEFNGLYWHSVKIKPTGYHLMKTNLCNQAGYRLIHIWEDDWIFNKKEIMNKLIDIFHKQENLNFTDTILSLDRCWFNNIKIPGYRFIKFTDPEMINKQNFQIENCGKIIFQKLNN